MGIQNFPGLWGLSWNQAYVQDFNAYIYNFTQIQETWKKQLICVVKHLVQNVWFSFSKTSLKYIKVS